MESVGGLRIGDSTLKPVRNATLCLLNSNQDTIKTGQIRIMSFSVNFLSLLSIGEGAKNRYMISVAVIFMVLCHIRMPISEYVVNKHWSD